MSYNIAFRISSTIFVLCKIFSLKETSAYHLHKIF
ncbi:unnamed protein product [Tenebrio molitor]|nr:unnamed protein product [Tenebrio molitor]